MVPYYKRPPLINQIKGCKEITERLRPIVGVYVICRGTTVEYVGQSVDVMTRVRQHREHYDRRVSTVYYVPCRQHELNEVEAALIRTLKPTRNAKNSRGDYATNTSPRGHRDAEIISQLTGEV